MCFIKESFKILVIITIINISVINALPALKSNKIVSSPPKISWIQQMRMLRHLSKECEKSTPVTTNNSSSTWQCLKVTSLSIIDDMTRHQVIPLWQGVRFVKTSSDKGNQLSLKLNENDAFNRKDLQHLTWFDRLALSFTRMLKTHMLEINLKEFSEAYVEYENGKDSSNTTDPVGTARHRRHRLNMMMTMMFGVTAFGAVLIPMGFQMLSIVSGKALLLAKMALLLASINGLKRVANSGVHYGLYHVPGEHYANYYDRGDVHHPRNVQNMVRVEQPIEVGLTV
ncbi:DUF1676 domain-containing protein Osi23 [Cochliomyia hominivorax]